MELLARLRRSDYVEGDGRGGNPASIFNAVGQRSNARIGQLYAKTGALVIMSEWQGATSRPTLQFMEWFDREMERVRAMPMPLTEAYFAKILAVEGSSEASARFSDSSQSAGIGAFQSKT